MPDPSPDLDLDADAMRELLEAASAHVLRHVTSLGRQPAADTEGAPELAQSLVESMPEEGSSLEETLELLFERAIPRSFNTASPGYLAYIPGGGLFASAVASLIGAAANRYVGVWAAAPALVQLETNVVRWFCDLVGYGAGSGGILTSGGSLANFSAIVMARVSRLPENFLKGTLYASEEAHHSIRKAALLAGFPARNVRAVPTDGHFRLDVGVLRAAVAADRAAGLQPFLVAASAGTTNTGAVDDLDEIASFAAVERLAFHVDAAYGGFFLMTERGRAALQGIERADSVVLDPHKGLFLPYGNGALVVKDAAALRRAHSVPADYLPETQEEPGRVDFCELSPELSRDFRGLRVWLPLRLHGAAAFRRALDEKLDLTLEACAGVREIPHVRIVAEPQLSLFAFRLEPRNVTGEALDVLNRRWLQAVNARQRVHLSGTVIRGRFALRICVLSFRTHQDRIRVALEDLRASAAQAMEA
jgi:aromatic-L-amino-acid/L-tryptophan decarboxylase